MLPLGEKSLSISLLEVLPHGCTLLNYLSPFAPALQITLLLACSQPCLNCGYASNWPWCLRRFLQQATSISHVPGLQLPCKWTCCGRCGRSSDSGLLLSTLSPPPTPSQCTCLTKATAAKARPVSAVGALVVCSDVLRC